MLLYLENTFQLVICKIAAILSRGHWDDHHDEALLSDILHDMYHVGTSNWFIVSSVCFANC